MGLAVYRSGGSRFRMHCQGHPGIVFLVGTLCARCESDHNGADSSHSLADSKAKTPAGPLTEWAGF